MRIRIKINTDWVYPVIEEDSFTITMNSTNTSLINPSEVVSDFSYSFTLPICDENNRLFKGFCYLDSIFNIQQVGFNPGRSMPCIVEGNNGSTICVGRCYMNGIDKLKYSFTLIGSLGNCIKDLLNSGWDEVTAAEDETYTLFDDFLKYSGTVNDTPQYNNNPVINRYSCYTSWMIPPESILFSLDALETAYRNNHLKALYNLTNDGNVSNVDAYAMSIVGLAPVNQGLYGDDKFDSSQWLTLQNGQPIQLPLFDTPGHERGIDVEDGLTEHQMCQYRTYYQQPYMFVNKLWDWYRRKAKSVCGYDLVLDNRWFTGSNQQLRDMVVTLKQPDVEKEVAPLLQDDNNTTRTDYLPKFDKYDDSTHKVTGLHAVTLEHNSETFDLEKDEVATGTFQFAIECAKPSSAGMLFELRAGQIAYWNMNRPLYVWADLLDSNNNLLEKRMYSCWLLPSNKNNDGDDYTYETGNWNLINQTVFNYVAPSAYNVDSVKFGDFQLSASYVSDTPRTGLHWRWSVSIQGDDTPFMMHYGPGYSDPDIQYTYPVCGFPIREEYYNPIFRTQDVINRVEVKKSTRSNVSLSLNSLFNGMNPFGILLKCAKMLDLVWVVDDLNQTITVKQRNDYYSDCMTDGVLDITDKIDMSKSVTIEPIAWTATKLVFNYDDAVQEDYIKGYFDKYNRTFGSKSVYTQDTRTREVTNMFGTTNYDKLVPSCISTSLLKPYKCYENGNGFIQKETDAMISNIKDSKQAKITGNFYYRRLNAPLSEEMHFNGYSKDGRGYFVMLTDDSPTEICNNQYCWGNDYMVGLGIYQRPVFDVCDRTEAYSIQFAEPAERYNYYEYDPNVKYLYDASWKNYIEDYYSIQNKSLKVYVVMNEKLYRRLRLNPLVCIRNVLYEVMNVEYDVKEGKGIIKARQIYDINKLTHHG